MEPLAALSLVSNVIQIVDFSSRVVSKSSELYNSCDGRLVQHTDIAIASADLSKLTTRLSESIELLSVHKSLCEDDRALYDLCKGCVDVSNELQNGLAKLQVTGAPSRWKSLRKALKSIWSKEHISELQSSLTQYREQLDSRILMGLRSKLDVVELRQLEGFDKLDDSVRALVGALYQASAQVELQVERQAVITDASIESHVRFAEENIVKAVKTTTTTHQRGLQSVEAKLTVLHTSEAENLEGTHKSRDDVIASIASSTAASSEDHETTRDELKRQMKSAEEQIAGLREELRQIKDMIGESVRKATLSKAKPGSEQQKKLVEHTNMLYMVMVAKDVMLQSLLDLIEAIQSRLTNYTKALTSVKWKIDPYQSAKLAVKWSVSTRRSERISAIEARMFEAIQSGSLSMMPACSEMRAVINNPQVVQLALQDLDPQTALFYSTVLGSEQHTKTDEHTRSTLPITSLHNSGLPPATERSVSDVSVASAQEMSQALDVEIGALTWAVFTLSGNAGQVQHAILDLLIDAGADRKARDLTGLCAYDHARVLKLGDPIIKMLNPFEHAYVGVSFGLLDAIKKDQPKAALGFLQRMTSPGTLDKMNQSPLALAIHEGVPEVFERLLEVGFSPFAGYLCDTDYYPSLAVSYLINRIHVRGPFSAFSRDLEKSFKDWVCAQGKVSHPSTPLGWAVAALNAHRNCVEGSETSVEQNLWGDFCALSAVLDHDDCVRLSLDRPTAVAGVSVDSFSWSLYAAIRRGNVGLVVQLLDQPSVVAERELDQRHFLSSWWPWDCLCEKAIHFLGTRTLTEYAWSLEQASLCRTCENRIDDYQAIASCTKYLSLASSSLPVS